MLEQKAIAPRPAALESFAARGARSVAPASLFDTLERQARRLQWFLLTLVLVVALAPATVFVIKEVDYFQATTLHNARHLATALASEIQRSGADGSALAARAMREMEAHGFAALRLTGRGVDRVEIGGPDRSVFATTITLPLTLDAAPFEQLRVEADSGRLLRRGAWVFGIHLVAAALLALVIYGVPMRALRLAVREVERANDQVIHSAKLSAVGEMYAGIAHEINNPVGIILSRVRLLLATPQESHLSPELVRDLEVIERHGDRICEVVRGLLAFARKAPFEPVETDINQAIEDMVALVRGAHAKHGVRVETILDPSLPAVRASRDHLQQVVVNLLNNARDAMPDGGTITLRTYRAGARLGIEVRDTGVGIAPQIRERIFEPFFTTKEVGQGTGLGLSVSYGIVKAHGGDIDVESEPGRGALFRVTLPLATGRR